VTNDQEYLVPTYYVLYATYTMLWLPENNSMVSC